MTPSERVELALRRTQTALVQNLTLQQESPLDKFVQRFIDELEKANKEAAR